MTARPALLLALLLIGAAPALQAQTQRRSFPAYTPEDITGPYWPYDYARLHCLRIRYDGITDSPQERANTWTAMQRRSPQFHTDAMTARAQTPEEVFNQQVARALQDTCGDRLAP
ncbi:hypothetical protein EVJ50_10000 [Synechococcus sp. RSCCF101]|uniref:hypothetical protein n=1 Tax=Synechococcus sp. RSCCF101 TaxID=2511069 RepID=UPI0012481159|nr:hypothetical protein [Synechococcus sp. RSCCF101]QEY32499.1 hypothetical protein EVJ50_10000 [Synechococcus sp. RSCCF101]